MIEGLPLYITLLFVLTVLGTIFWFYFACRSKAYLIIALVWTVVQSIIGIEGLYLDTWSIPPRIMLFGIFPALVLIIVTFLTRTGREFTDGLDLKTLTYFHTIRIPVEIVLVLLFHHGLVSVYMTFEGTNFDMFSGLTAPLIGYLAFRAVTPARRLLLGWNILCLLLLLNVVVTAVFALPSPFQQLSLDQPNTAILHFPFSLLPAVVVPTVLFAHLAAIRHLTRSS